MTILISAIALFVICLAVSDFVSERDVVRSRMSKLEDKVRELETREQMKKNAKHHPLSEVG